DRLAVHIDLYSRCLARSIVGKEYVVPFVIQRQGIQCCDPDPDPRRVVCWFFRLDGVCLLLRLRRLLLCLALGHALWTLLGLQGIQALWSWILEGCSLEQLWLGLALRCFRPGQALRPTVHQVDIDDAMIQIKIPATVVLVCIHL